MINDKKIEKLSDRNDLLSTDEILELYEKYRKENNWPDDAKVSKRTFRFWNTKGLFSPPIRGKYNRALYPMSIVGDISVIRVSQLSYGLTIEQIKDLFSGLPVSYHEAIEKLRDVADQKKLRELLSSNQPDKISLARNLILDSIPEGYEKRKQVEYLKQISIIYKEIDENLYYNFLSKTGDELFSIAVSEYELLEDDEANIISRIRARFITTVLGIVRNVRQNIVTQKEGLESLKRLKPVDYKLAVLMLKKQQQFFKLKQMKKADHVGRT